MSRRFVDLETLIETVRRGWPTHFGSPAAALPDDATLRCLIETCLEASFTVEEGRQTRFTVRWSKRAMKPLRRIGRSITLSPNLIRFALPRHYKADELRRLAPATQAAFEAIEVAGEHPHLVIVGLIELRNERDRDDVTSGDSLSIDVLEPFSLKFRKGHYVFIELRRGQVYSPIQNTLVEGPVNAFFANVIDELPWFRGRTRNAFTRERVYLDAIRYLVDTVRELGHGGLLLFVNSDAVDSATRHLTFKYAATDFHRQIWPQILHRVHRATRPSTIKVASIESSADEFGDGSKNNSSLLAGALVRAARLTQVDGALLMTTDFSIAGFGAKVEAQSPEIIYECKDAGAKQVEEVRADGSGMRHRAAYGFAASVSGSLAFVFSQDGGIRAVRSLDGHVYVWPNVEMNSFPLLKARRQKGGLVN